MGNLPHLYTGTNTRCCLQDCKTKVKMTTFIQVGRKISGFFTHANITILLFFLLYNFFSLKQQIWDKTLLQIYICYSLSKQQKYFFSASLVFLNC